MALIRFGGGITEMRGSIAGNTYARNRFGAYSRARTKPVNPRSSRQMGARIAVMYLAEQWRESPMTDVIRTAWETYAGSVNWQNKLGEVTKLTGFNHFIRSNAALVSVNGTLVTAGPLVLGLPPGDPAFVISNVTAAAQTADLAFDDGFDWAGEDDAYFSCQMGQPQNATRNFFNGPWRQCFFIAGNTAVPVTSPQAGLPNIPYTLVEGQKVWWRARIIRADGRVSTHFRCDPTIVAA